MDANRYLGFPDLYILIILIVVRSRINCSECLRLKYRVAASVSVMVAKHSFLNALGTLSTLLFYSLPFGIGGTIVGFSMETSATR